MAFGGAGNKVRGALEFEPHMYLACDMWHM